METVTKDNDDCLPSVSASAPGSVSSPDPSPVPSLDPSSVLSPIPSSSSTLTNFGTNPGHSVNSNTH